MSLRLSLLLCICLCRLDAQEKNPFLEMVGKPYAEYHDAYFYAAAPLDGDSSARNEVMCQLAEAAALDKGKEWPLLLRMVTAGVRYTEQRHGGYVVDSVYSQQFIDEMNEIGRLAVKYDLPHIKLWTLFYIAEAYRRFVNNYYLAFDSFLHLAAGLEHTTTKLFPPRPWMLCHIANLYANFRDFHTAIVFYKKVVTDADAAFPQNLYSTYPAAYNGLGLCYRHTADLALSDECYRSILRQDRPTGMWEGIVDGALGENSYLRGDYDSAIVHLRSSIRKIVRVNDFLFASNRAVTLAHIYLQKGNLQEAKQFIDTAIYKHRLTLLPEKSSALYSALSEYHIAMGNLELGTAYLDSAMMLKERESEEFDGLVLQRVEQQMSEEKLQAARRRSRTYQLIAGLIFAVLLTSIVFLMLYRRLYLKKREAYAELVRKAEQWASANIVPVRPTDDDHRLLEAVHRLMVDEKIFTKSDLTMEVLAARLRVSRHTLSRAVNAVTGMNFNRFVNEYRIKEAVRILSSSQRYDVYIDELYDRVGFAGRTTFYTAFKKVTGLSPREFMKSL